MIIYNRMNKNIIKVIICGNFAGRIKKVDTGWRYCPINHYIGGDVFKTVREVKDSIEIINYSNNGMK